MRRRRTDHERNQARRQADAQRQADDAEQLGIEAADQRKRRRDGSHEVVHSAGPAARAAMRIAPPVRCILLGRLLHTLVMPGLVPGIHVLVSAQKDVDGRDKPGHDEMESSEALGSPEHHFRCAFVPCAWE